MQPATFTTKLSSESIPKLEKDLQEQGFSFTKPLHTVFSAKKKGVICTLYESGTLVVQGKDKASFIEFYLEPEILNAFTFTYPQANVDTTARIGLDEAGKGDFFGPLCIAGVYADQKGILQLVEMGVKDSKRFSDASIRKLAKKIREAYSFVLIRLFPKKYNELYGQFKNLNRLLAWAHSAALSDLIQKTGCKKAILDQFADPSLVKRALEQKNVVVDLEQRVRAEEDAVVAAASIVARAGFLEGLETLSQEVGSELLKGASSAVLQCGIRLVQKEGPDILNQVGKTHFKTKSDILARASQN